jgi:hypothetical protein
MTTARQRKRCNRQVSGSSLGYMDIGFDRQAFTLRLGVDVEHVLPAP